MEEIHELDLVILENDHPGESLEKGDIGTVVHVYQDEAAYEVEFLTASGKTVAVLTLEQSDVRPANDKEVFHARLRAAS